LPVLDEECKRSLRVPLLDEREPPAPLGRPTRDRHSSRPASVSPLADETHAWGDARSFSPSRTRLPHCPAESRRDATRNLDFSDSSKQSPVASAEARDRFAPRCDSDSWCRNALAGAQSSVSPQERCNRLGDRLGRGTEERAGARGDGLALQCAQIGGGWSLDMVKARARFHGAMSASCGRRPSSESGHPGSRRCRGWSRAEHSGPARAICSGEALLRHDRVGVDEVEPRGVVRTGTAPGTSARALMSTVRSLFPDGGRAG
jgi:hypothetical protein